MADPINDYEVLQLARDEAIMDMLATLLATHPKGALLFDSVVARGVIWRNTIQVPDPDNWLKHHHAAVERVRSTVDEIRRSKWFKDNFPELLADPKG